MGVLETAVFSILARDSLMTGFSMSRSRLGLEKSLDSIIELVGAGVMSTETDAPATSTARPLTVTRRKLKLKSKVKCLYINKLVFSAVPRALKQG